MPAERERLTLLGGGSKCGEGKRDYSLAFFSVNSALVGRKLLRN